MNTHRAQPERIEVKREEFADGSALLTYSDGSQLILESNLAKQAVAREGRAVNYNEPPPAPPASISSMPL